MKLYELFETKSAVFTFGRFNPPHKGHGLVFEQMKEIANEQKADMFVVPSKTIGLPKNPLTFEQKKFFIENMFGVNVFENEDVTNPYNLAGWLSENNYKNVTMVVGDDRRHMFDGINEYVNHTDKTKSYNFNNFNFVSAGKRLEESDDITGASATKVRQSVVENDFDKFSTFMPDTNISIIENLFNTLKEQCVK